RNASSWWCRRPACRVGARRNACGAELPRRPNCEREADPIDPRGARSQSAAGLGERDEAVCWPLSLTYFNQLRLDYTEGRQEKQTARREVCGSGSAAVGPV